MPTARCRTSSRRVPLARLRPSRCRATSMPGSRRRLRASAAAMFTYFGITTGAFWLVSRSAKSFAFRWA